jgi:uncharacterized protein (TIGR03083 family)
MTATAIDVTGIEPISHREAYALARTEYRRFADLLATVEDDEWALPTDCAGWTVRDLAGHMVGAMRSASSIREQIRQQREIARRTKRDGGNRVDTMTAVQIGRTAALTPEALVTECWELVDRAALGRKRTPLPIRRMVSIPVETGSISERWKIGYLVDVILTRDTWMHRVDLSRAIGADLQLDGSHDGRIVADVVVEWARRHGRPCTLTLTGPAGGTYAMGASGPSLEVDAVEFCRILSGRASGEGLLTHGVPF